MFSQVKEKDDLTRIKWVRTARAQVLHDVLAITSFADLAATDPYDLKMRLAAAGHSVSDQAAKEIVAGAQVLRDNGSVRDTASSARKSSQFNWVEKAAFTILFEEDETGQQRTAIKAADDALCQEWLGWHLDKLRNWIAEHLPGGEVCATVDHAEGDHSRPFGAGDESSNGNRPVSVTRSSRASHAADVETEQTVFTEPPHLHVMQIRVSQPPGNTGSVFVPTPRRMISRPVGAHASFGLDVMCETTLPALANGGVNYCAHFFAREAYSGKCFLLGEMRLATMEGTQCCLVLTEGTLPPGIYHIRISVLFDQAPGRSHLVLPMLRVVGNGRQRAEHHLNPYAAVESSKF